MMNRDMVSQDVVSAGASIDGTLRDANDRRWPAGPAPALPSTAATTVATTARADGQRGESADSNERVRPTDGAGQDSRAGGLDASTRPTGPQRPSGRRLASPVECRPRSPTSMVFARTQYWRGTAARECADVRRVWRTDRNADIIAQKRICGRPQHQRPQREWTFQQAQLA
jgi:hypothetical protein